MSTHISDPFAGTSGSIRFGRWLFRKRDFTPVPLILFAALLAMPSIETIAVGLVVMIAGDCMRLWGISYIGGISRTRSDVTGQLIRSGPFGRTRNPLYVGNFLVSTGAVILTGLWWLVPVFVILFAIQYHFIILYEENNLRRKYQEDYNLYCKQVPRWLPFGPGKVDSANPIKPSFARALRSERRTFAAMLVIAAIFVVKLAFLPDETLLAAILNLFGNNPPFFLAERIKEIALFDIW